MNILLAFAPFIVFALVDRFVGATPGLIAAAIVAAGMITRDRLMLGKEPKVLEIGTVILFGALALYSVFARPEWSIVGVRLLVDLGLLAIVLISLAIRRPFTLQYAREDSPKEIWDSPQFVRANYVITAVWALAFAVLVIADIIMLESPNLHRFGILLTIAALVGAYRFTDWYPNRLAAGA